MTPDVLTPDAVFSLANTAILPAWLALAVRPRAAWSQRLAAWAVPGLLAAAYVAALGLTLAQPTGTDGGFGSLDELAALFADPRALLAGWLHYLAFDLLVGAWMARDAGPRGVPGWLLAPCLALTLFAGPAGWLLYVAAVRVVGPKLGPERSVEARGPTPRPVS